MRTFFLLTSILIICLFVQSPLAKRARYDCVESSIINEWVGREVILRRSINYSRVFYLNDSLGTYYYWNQDGPFIHTVDHRVTIDYLGSSDETAGGRQDNKRDEEFAKCTLIELRCSSDILENHTIYLTSESDNALTSKQIRDFLSTAFIVDSTMDSFFGYQKNEESGLIHATLSNHILRNNRQSELKSILPTDSADLCPICFRPIQAIPDLEVELYLARMGIDFGLSRYEEIEDYRQRTIDSLGHIVLANWPVPLRGYKYSFRLIVDDVPNAFALPAGTIFIRTGLYEAVDSNEELMSILAHEIAHVEFRHGYRKIKSKQKSKLWTSIITLAAGGIIAATLEDRSATLLALEASKEISEAIAEIVLSGYDRKQEMEADRMAALFMSSFVGDESNLYLTNVLNKLRYYSQEMPKIDYSNPLSDHPTIAKRLKYLKTGSLKMFTAPITFKAYDKDDNLVATFKVLASDGVVTLAELSATLYLRKSCKIKHFSIADISGTKLDNKEDTRVFPGQSVSLIFYGNFPSSFRQLVSEHGLDLKISSLKRWELVDDSL